MSSQYGEHRSTSHWDLLASLGHPCKFQCVSRLGSVTARHSSSGRQPNFAALNRGRHLYSAGRPSRWALAHICSYLAITFRRERITSNKLKHMYEYNYTTFFNITSLDLNIIENVWRIIQLKLQSENEVITRRPLSRERSYPCQYIDTTRNAVDCATILRLTFLYNESLQQTFRPLFSKLSKRRQI